MIKCYTMYPLHFPPFLGENKLNLYMEWEMKVEQLFGCHDINEGIKVKLVTLEFSGYALVWWYQVLYDVKRMRRPLCETWAKLKKELRERFVPSYYAKDLYIKLQRLYQESKSVEEYYKEMKVCFMRAQIKYSQKETMARFLHWLNREIQDIVKLYHYHNLEDLVHQATKTKLKLKRKFSYRKSDKDLGSLEEDTQEQDLFVNLQKMYQCPRSVDEYFKEMEMVESQEAIIARFLNDLNRDI
ncbi:hypothetical protein CR513_51044, partial [Mucuna pruriens]